MPITILISLIGQLKKQISSNPFSSQRQPRVGDGEHRGHSRGDSQGADSKKARG
jgi:hypothetical protein